ncbi:MAG: rhodanese-like domain-containing protein [Saprospiraceae bacterium]|nr:rhodanese-like domain-containing protein [Saprospiraceae bacterium]
MGIKQISRAELKEWQEEGKLFQLVDVREEEEHQHHNIGGLLIPLSELNLNLDKLNLDRPVVFYCRKGIRSQLAIQRLHKRFPEAEFYNLERGIF